jgi:cyclopropane fatty-acyl-phospholipid synthase-like methyltransferase
VTDRRPHLSGAEWRETDRAEEWPSVRQQLPHIDDAEAMLVEHLIPRQVGRILDLGTDDGHLIRLLREHRRGASAVGLDVSPKMLAAGQERFAGTSDVRLEVHDLMQPLPESLGRFDVVVSALAIHHLRDSRKRALFAEAFALLTRVGCSLTWIVFCRQAWSSTPSVKPPSVSTSEARILQTSRHL